MSICLTSKTLRVPGSVRAAISFKLPIAFSAGTGIEMTPVSPRLKLAFLAIGFASLKELAIAGFREWLKRHKNIDNADYDMYKIMNKKIRTYKWEFFKKDFFFEMYSLPLILFLFAVVPLLSLTVIGIMFYYLISNIGMAEFTKIYMENPIILLWGSYIIMIIPLIVFFITLWVIQIYTDGVKKEKSLKEELTKND